MNPRTRRVRKQRARARGHRRKKVPKRRIYPTFIITGTVTGRFRSSGGGYQP